mmetsp:Transcript_114615/g.228096  ORF Transcript_114615/g.228096 Transcript_114615/m.228096 type:complete len:526 (+) Transcript_114615:50-1627(+)
MQDVQARCRRTPQGVIGSTVPLTAEALQQLDFQTTSQWSRSDSGFITAVSMASGNSTHPLHVATDQSSPQSQQGLRDSVFSSNTSGNCNTWFSPMAGDHSGQSFPRSHTEERRSSNVSMMSVPSTNESLIYCQRRASTQSIFSIPSTDESMLYYSGGGTYEYRLGAHSGRRISDLSTGSADWGGITPSTPLSQSLPSQPGPAGRGKGSSLRRSFTGGCGSAVVSPDLPQRCLQKRCSWAPGDSADRFFPIPEGAAQRDTHGSDNASCSSGSLSDESINKDDRSAQPEERAKVKEPFGSCLGPVKGDAQQGDGQDAHGEPSIFSSGDPGCDMSPGTDDGSGAAGRDDAPTAAEGGHIPFWPTKKKEDALQTTVMLQSLPRSYTRDTLVTLLNENGFFGLFDFVYLPIKFVTLETFGYAFVNMVSEEAADKCMNVFNGFSSWPVQDPSVCRATRETTHHGQQAHIGLYRNSPVMHPLVPDAGKPAIFKDGLRTPFPPPTKSIRPPRPLVRQCRLKAIQATNRNSENA